MGDFQVFLDFGAGYNYDYGFGWLSCFLAQSCKANHFLKY